MQITGPGACTYFVCAGAFMLCVCLIRRACMAPGLHTLSSRCAPLPASLLHLESPRGLPVLTLGAAWVCLAWVPSTHTHTTDKGLCGMGAQSTHTHTHTHTLTPLAWGCGMGA